MSFHGSISPHIFGAKGDGSPGQTPFIQSAIDAAANLGGGNVSLEFGAVYGCHGLVLKDGVHIVAASSHGYRPASVGTPVLLSDGAGAVIDTPDTQVKCCGVHGVNITGLGASIPGNGVLFRNAFRSVIENVEVDGFADQGILVQSSSISCTLKDTFVLNALLNRTRTQQSGAIEVWGTDHSLRQVEGTASLSAISSSNLWCAGLYLPMSNGTLEDGKGSLSDIGIVLSGSSMKVSTTRADLNLGHGWVISGSSNVVSSSTSLSNSQAQDNAYDNWQIGGSDNSIVGPKSLSQKTARPRYGYNDLQNSDANKNVIVVPTATGSYGSAKFFNSYSKSASFVFGSGEAITLAQNSSTPDVSGSSFFVTSNTTSTLLTQFLGGVNGQNAWIFAGDNLTTFVHDGVNIATSNSQNIPLTMGRMYFAKKHGAWRINS